MNASHEFLRSLALVFSVAAATTLVSKRLKLPLVFGYILAGMIIGPHLPIPLVAEPQVVHSLAELGIIFLLFSLGLEFSIPKLARLAGSAGLIAVIEASIMFALGMTAARLLGWSPIESVFAGGITAISSTAIIVKTFTERGLMRTKLAELVVGILIFEDVVAILLLVVLTALGTQGSVTPFDIARTGAGVSLFVAGALLLGLALLPRIVRWMQPAANPELAIVFLIGVCFFFSQAAGFFGYSLALGAFLGGIVLSGAVEPALVHRYVDPVKNMFGAVFFVAVGMLVDPVRIAANWPAVVALLGVVLAGKFVAVSAGAVLAGNDSATALRAGFSMAQIGEFSFVIASLGVTLNVVRPDVFAVAVAVSALTTLSTPLFVKHAGRLADGVDRHLPKRMQTAVALYAAWRARLQGHTVTPAERTRVRRLARGLGADVAALIGLNVALALVAPSLARAVTEVLAVSLVAADWGVSLAWLAAMAPFLYGILRLARALGMEYAAQLWPVREAGALDLSNAPRTTLAVLLQLLFTALSATVVIAVTAPFLPEWESVFILVILLLPMLHSAWVTTGNLDGHVRASSQLVGEALAHLPIAGAGNPRNAVMDEIISGFGSIDIVALAATDFAVGKSLTELNLRGRTNATVVSLQRGDQKLMPDAATRLAAGDRLALAGSPETTQRAERLLRSGVSDD